MKGWILVAMLGLAPTAGAADVTDELAKGTTTVHVMYQDGQILGCSIKFNGIDPALNIFEGSLSLISPGLNQMTAAFKLVSKKAAAPTGDVRVLTLRKAWMSVGGNSTHAWRRTNGIDDEYFLSGPDSATAQPLELYLAVLGREPTFVGYLHGEEQFDAVYELMSLQDADIQEGLTCAARLVEKTTGRKRNEQAERP